MADLKKCAFCEAEAISKDQIFCHKCGNEIDPPKREEIKEEEPVMIEKKSWEEFCNNGFLWWANRMLHVFGWAIVVEMDDAKTKILDVYPARCKFRGFGEKSIEKNYIKVSQYMAENGPVLLHEARSK